MGASLTIAVMLALSQSPRMLGDLNTLAGSEGSDPRSLRESGSLLYFVVYDGLGAQNLWCTDGSAPATRRVPTSTADAGQTTFRNLTGFGTSGLLFVADTPGGAELMLTDCTSVTSLATVAVDSHFNIDGTPPMTVSGTRAFFTVAGELWMTDGTPAGTVAVPGAPGSSPFELPVAAAGLVFFKAATGGLWRTDGTFAGTQQVPGVSSATQLTAGATRLFFYVASSRAYWETDGTTAREIGEGAAPPQDRNSHAIVTVGDTAYFHWSRGMMPAQTELSFSVAGANMVSVGTFGQGSTPIFMGGVAGFLLVLTPNAVQRVEPAIPFLLTVRGLSSAPTWGVTTGTQVFFDQASGNELWRTDGSASNTARVLALANRFSERPVRFGTNLAATYDDNVSGTEPWRFSAAGATLLADVNQSPRAFGSNPQGFTWLDGDLQNPQPIFGAVYFTALEADGGRMLYATDGGLVSRFTTPSPAPAQYGSELFAHKGRLYFAATESGQASAHWTDGRYVNAAQVPGGLYNPRGFFGTDAGVGYFAQRFMPGGLASVLTLLAPNGFTRDLSVAQFVAPLVIREELYCAVDAELWFSDFTANGTTQIASPVRGGAPLGDGIVFLNFSGQLGTATRTFTSAIDAGSGVQFQLIHPWGEGVALSTAEGQLWSSDGTAAGTRQRTSFASGVPLSLSTAGDLLIASTLPIPPNQSYQLWATDGTPAGTVALASFSFAAQGLTSVGSLVFFAAPVPDAGTELWRTDGTPEGTRPVGDLAPGAASSSPSGFTRIGTSVYFSASTPAAGLEPWVMTIDPTPPEIDAGVVGTAGPSGWYRGSVEVRFAVTDPESPVESTLGCGAQQLQGDSADASVACVARSSGGRSERRVHVAIDNTPPVVSCAQDVVFEAEGPNGARWSQPALTATDALDPAPLVSFGLAPDAGIPLGPSSVTVTALDHAGNTATCSLTARVEDTIAPQVSCPPNDSLPPDGPDGRTIALDSASATDTVDPSPTLTYRSHAGVEYQHGAPATLALNSKTTFTVTATDASGNSASCSFDVTIACLDGLCPTAQSPRTLSQYSWGCASAGGEAMLGLLLAGLLRRRTRRTPTLARGAMPAFVLVLLGSFASPAFAAPPLRLVMADVSGPAGTPPAELAGLSDVFRAAMTGITTYEVLTSKDVAARLGLQREKQLLGCAEDAQACMSEIAEAMNSDRVLRAEVSQLDGYAQLVVTLTQGDALAVIARATRRAGDLSGLADELTAAVYEVLNKDPARAAEQPLVAERGFGGFMAGVRGDFDAIGLGGAPAIVVQYSGRRFGVALTGLIKTNPGARLEVRWFPVTLGRVRPVVLAGGVASRTGAGVRVGAGFEIHVGHFNAFLDAAYERYLYALPEYLLDAATIGAGVGWTF